MTGKVIEYTYNTLNLLETVKDNRNKEASSYVYYADGTIKSLKSGRLYTEYVYDADRNLIGLKTLLGKLFLEQKYSQITIIVMTITEIGQKNNR